MVHSSALKLVFSWLWVYVCTYILLVWVLNTLVSLYSFFRHLFRVRSCSCLVISGLNLAFFSFFLRFNSVQAALSRCLTHKDCWDQPLPEPQSQPQKSEKNTRRSATCSTVDANLKFTEHGAFILYDSPWLHRSPIQMEKPKAEKWRASETSTA